MILFVLSILLMISSLILRIICILTLRVSRGVCALIVPSAATISFLMVFLLFQYKDTGYYQYVHTVILPVGTIDLSYNGTTIPVTLSDTSVKVAVYLRPGTWYRFARYRYDIVAVQSHKENL